MSDQLGQLLREADASAGRPAAPRADLGAVVRRVARRRRTVRAAAGGAVVMIVGMCGMYLMRPNENVTVVQRETAPSPPSLSPEQARREIAMLAAEAESRMAVVERMLEMERRRGSATRQRATDPLLAVRREQDRAAYLLIYEADRLARKSEARERAVEEYRRVVALFPDTHWASVARERLVEMGGSSRKRTAAPINGAEEELS
jgi:hypothetical protein